MSARVLCIFMGGTIAMDASHGTASTSYDQARALDESVKGFGGEGLADVAETFELANADSTNINVRNWEELVDLVGERYDEFDGFLISMGTNTLAYVSSALSFALHAMPKPLVVTGAQVPFGQKWSDGTLNLVNSLRWLEKAHDLSVGGVYVVFGSQLIWGSRAKKLVETSTEAFVSFNEKAVGEFGPGITLNNTIERSDPKRPFVARNGFDEAIVSITVVPGLTSDTLKRIVDGGIRGVILRSFGSGDIPDYLFPFLDHARALEVPIVNTTQCPQGKTLMGLNDVGLQARAKGVIPAYDMSMEAMSTKLMWLLRQMRDQRIQFKELVVEMTQRLSHEINPKLVEEADRYFGHEGLLTLGG